MTITWKQSTHAFMLAVAQLVIGISAYAGGRSTWVYLIAFACSALELAIGIYYKECEKSEEIK